MCKYVNSINCVENIHIKHIIYTINTLMSWSVKNRTYPQQRYSNLLGYGKRRGTKYYICNTINSHGRGAFEHQQIQPYPLFYEIHTSLLFKLNVIFNPVTSTPTELHKINARRMEYHQQIVSLVHSK